MWDFGLITKAVIAAAIAVALAMVGLFIYEAGADATDAKWLKQEAVQRDENAKKLADRQRAADARELDHLKEMADAASTYMLESAENERKANNEKAAATATSRSTGLWVDVTRPAFGGMPATFGAGAARALDGAGETSRARLADSTSQFLIDLTSGGDGEIGRLKTKVAALQDVITSYQKVCK